MSELLNVNSALTEWEHKIIGKGLLFPKSVNVSIGSLNISEGFDRINQSIKLILNTPIGSRIGNRKFGSTLSECVFEDITEITKQMIRMSVNDALRDWEPRINVSEVTFVDDDELTDSNILGLVISYSLKDSDLSGNYVHFVVK